MRGSYLSSGVFFNSSNLSVLFHPLAPDTWWNPEGSDICSFHLWLLYSQRITPRVDERRALWQHHLISLSFARCSLGERLTLRRCIFALIRQKRARDKLSSSLA